MSRIGKKAVSVPNGVTATVNGQLVSVKGPKGELKETLNEHVSVVMNDGGIKVDPRDKSIQVVDLRAGKATKLGREGILDSILNPSAVIAAGYEPWLIETKDGETYSGFIVSNSDTVILKEPSGGTRSIPAKQIASRQQQKLSLMPDNTSLGLTPQELLDLVEYLLTEPAAAKP